jgi:hypothetical protein
MVFYMETKQILEIALYTGEILFLRIDKIIILAFLGGIFPAVLFNIERKNMLGQVC